MTSTRRVHRWQPRRGPLARGWPWSPRARRALLIGLVGITCALAGYGLLPYLALWRLDRALGQGPAALAPLVDIAAVRDQLHRRLDKDQPSLVGGLSDPFIDWLAHTLRGGGAARLEQTVTLDWVHGLLRERADPTGALLPMVRYAWFDLPTRFRVRLGPPDHPPLQLLWRPALSGWRVVAVYY